MPGPFASKRRPARRAARAVTPGLLTLGLLAALAGGARAAPGAAVATAAAPAPGLDFDRAFSDRGEPRFLHFTARYTAHGSPHTLEAWRSGATMLRRQTDGVIDSYTIHRPRDAEYRLVVLDRPHRIATRIDRSNLYRIGNFTDWFDLAHALRHPKGAYRLTAGAAPAGAAPPLAACRWYDLASGDGQRSTLCWSPAWRLPLAIYSGDAPQPVWQVTSVSTDRIAPAVFAIDDTGFVRNDANRDISGD